MLPPIDESVLQSNPKFAALYSTLTNNILNPSGSTRKHPAQKERDAVSEALKSARIQDAKTQLIRSGLKSLDLSPPSTSTSTSTRASAKQAAKQQPPLPSELIELILLLSARLSSPSLPTSSTHLLETTSQWCSLPTYLPTISSLLSSHLHTQALALSRIHAPTTNASFLHRTIPKLVPGTHFLQDSIAKKKAALEHRRQALVSNTTTLLSIYHLASALTIQILESSKHGGAARHARARADLLSAQAAETKLDAGEKKARAEKQVYSEEVRRALANYVRHLRDARERLRERRSAAERALWGYGVGRKEGEGLEKEKVMKEIARVYGELVKEVAEVGRDVERLRGR